jgi:broad specificity phosphatase PhoE
MTDTDWLQEPSRAVKHLIFARHGEYECNLAGVCNCNPRTPYPLTEKGRRQAELLGERLRGAGIEAIVCSEFLRARQTAALANAALGLPILVNSLANENRVGAAFEGRHNDDFLASIAHDPAHAAQPDGESFSQMLARIRKLLEDLSRSSPQTILIITHGWVLQGVRALLGDIAAAEGAMCVDMPGNCCTESVVYAQGRLTREGAIALPGHYFTK